MKISDAGLDLIKQHEGCVLEAYQDSVEVWTIGVGHTLGVKMGDKITQQEADDFLRADCYVAETCVNTAVRVPLTQNEFDALVSLVFNIGCRAFRDSTLLKLLNQSDYDGAEQQFLRWDKAGGQTLSGLTKRRKAESELFASAGNNMGGTG